MRIGRRRERVPDWVRNAVPLARGERVIAASGAPDGTFPVATDRALYVVSGTPDAATAVRTRWDLVDRAVWDPPVINVESRPAPDQSPVRWQVQADPHGDVPAVVRDRVTNSIVVNHRLPVRGGTARLIARRNSDDGRLYWRVALGAGVDPDDPEVRATTAAELDELRSRLGV